MSKTKIYLAGGMSAFADSPKKAMEWRFDINDALKEEYTILDPTERFWQDSEPDEKLAMNWDLYNVRNSDLLVVNLNDPKSIGTAMEIAIASELRIPIIALNEENLEIHPWIEMLCWHIFSDREDMLSYIRQNH